MAKGGFTPNLNFGDSLTSPIDSQSFIVAPSIGLPEVGTDNEQATNVSGVVELSAGDLQQIADIERAKAVADAKGIPNFIDSAALNSARMTQKADAGTLSALQTGAAEARAIDGEVLKESVGNITMAAGALTAGFGGGALAIAGFEAFKNLDIKEAVAGLKSGLNMLEKTAVGTLIQHHDALTPPNGEFLVQQGLRNLIGKSGLSLGA